MGGLLEGEQDGQVLVSGRGSGSQRQEGGDEEGLEIVFKNIFNLI